MSMLRYLRFSPLFLLPIFLMGACGSPAPLSTSPMAEQPSVDGSIEEWDRRFTQVADRPVSAAALPTDSLLYVAVLIQDRSLVQSIAMNGLVLWVDPSGGTKRAYGVQYPLGMRRQLAGQTSSEGRGVNTAQFDDVSLTELEVVRGDSVRQRIPARFSEGLRGKATLDPASLVYEVAIPVDPPSTSSEWHGLRSALSSSVGLGLEIPQPEEEIDVSPSDNSAPSITGRGGRGRRGGRQGRQRQQQQQSESSKLASLDLWMTVPANGTP